MINFLEVKELLEQNSNKLRCHKIGLKPLDLALSISIVSNSVEDYGYIIIGAERINNRIQISGLSASVNIETPIKKAKELFGEHKPELEFTNMQIESCNIFVVKVKKHVGQLRMALTNEYLEKEDRFIYDLFYACVKLQEDYLYKNQKEDDRNTFIAAILEAKGYKIKDQTRRGLSQGGKNAGEVDLFVQNELNMPLTIVEALNLDSLNQSYLNKHIDKIYNYDTTGNKFNICLSYVTVSDFGTFWNKYLNHIKDYDYKHALVEVNEEYEDKFLYSEIRIIKMVHIRNDKKTNLYHIAVNLS